MAKPNPRIKNPTQGARQLHGEKGLFSSNLKFDVRKNPLVADETPRMVSSPDFLIQWA